MALQGSECFHKGLRGGFWGPNMGLGTGLEARAGSQLRAAFILRLENGPCVEQHTFSKPQRVQCGRAGALQASGRMK